MRQASDIQNQSRALGLNGLQGAHGMFCIFLHNAAGMFAARLVTS